MTTTLKVNWGSQPLTRTVSADFTTEYGTRFQIVAFLDSTAVTYGVKNPDFGDQWTHGVFHYADKWRENHGWPSVWTTSLFKMMVADFLTAEEEN